MSHKKRKARELWTFPPQRLEPGDPDALAQCLKALDALPVVPRQDEVALYAHTLLGVDALVSGLYADEFLADGWRVVEQIRQKVTDRYASRAVTRFIEEARTGGRARVAHEGRDGPTVTWAVRPIGPAATTREWPKVGAASVGEVAFREACELARGGWWTVTEVPAGTRPRGYTYLFNPPAGATAEHARLALQLWEHSVDPGLSFAAAAEAVVHARGV